MKARIGKDHWLWLMRTGIVCCLWLCIVFFALPCSSSGEHNADAFDFPEIGEDLAARALLEEWYQERQGPWVWVEKGGLTSQGTELYTLLDEAKDQGLPGSYHLGEIEAYWMLLLNRSPEEWLGERGKKLEILLTHAFFLYTMDYLILEYTAESLDWEVLSQEVQFSFLPLLQKVAQEKEVARYIREFQLHDALLAFYSQMEYARAASLMEDVYADRDYQPIWVQDGRNLTALGQELYALLNRAHERGLNPQDYYLDQIDGIWMNLLYRRAEDWDPLHLMRMDLIMTDAFFSYSADIALRNLMIDDMDWDDVPEEIKEELPDLLSDIVQNNRIEDILADFHPFSYSLALDGLTVSMLTGDILQGIYRQRTFEPVWLADNDLNEQGRQLFTFILDARQWGLDPSDYHVQNINNNFARVRTSVGTADPHLLLELELLLTEAFLMIVSDLSTGRVHPRDLYRDPLSSSVRRDAASLLQRVEEEQDVLEIFKARSPQHRYYQETLAILQEGIESGSLTAGEIQEISLNLERWRWLPNDFGPRHILVNQPSFHLEVFEEDNVIMDMKTIVGRRDRPTPNISSTMTHMVLSPRWYMPTSIAIRDYLPRVQQNPNYLTERNYRVYERENGRFREVDPQDVDWDQQNRENFSYYFWQDPGPFNSLGRVIFRFPNAQDIYLHDTPERHLFNETVRTYSSGCIRIEKPIELALYLLADQPEWDRQAINEVIDRRRETTVYLKETLGVHLTYFTVLPAGDGTLNFYQDIYNRNQGLLDAFDRRREDVDKGGEF